MTRASAWAPLFFSEIFVSLHLKMKRTLFYLILVALTLGFAACSHTKDPGPAVTAVNIVTYESTLADGSVSTFTYTDAKGDLITLSANWKAPESIKPGRRMLITYAADEYGVSGPVVLYGIQPLPGGDIVCRADVPGSEPLSGVAVSRSGNYIDFRGVVSFTGDAEEISMYAPDVDAEVPELYVVVRRKADGVVGNGAPRTLYASWSLESVGGFAEKTAFNVVYTDISNRPQTITVTSSNN